MAISVVMPALEMAQENGRLLAWRKAEGDRVNKGEPLLEIETDKAVVEIPSPSSGRIGQPPWAISSAACADRPRLIPVASGEKEPTSSCSVDQGIYGHLTLRNLAVLAEAPRPWGKSLFIVSEGR